MMLSCGAASSTVAQIITYPLALAKTRLHLGSRGPTPIFVAPSSQWASGPVDPAGRVATVSERNLFCLAVHGDSAVVGGADHGLHEIELRGGAVGARLLQMRHGARNLGLHERRVERGAAGRGAVRGHFLGARAAAPLENCFVLFELWPRLGVALARLRGEGDQRASTG